MITQETYSYVQQRNPNPSADFPSLKIRKILLPVNKSHMSFALLKGASMMAQKAGASLHLLHVADKSPKQREHSSSGQNFEESLRQWSFAVLEGKSPATFTIRAEDLEDAILAEAKETSADLIIMPSRPTNEGMQLSRERAAEIVCRTAPCPVLTLTPRSVQDFMRAFGSFPSAAWKRIFVPTDLNPGGENALNYAAAIARETGGSIVLGHSVRPGEAIPSNLLQRWVDSKQSRGVIAETMFWRGSPSIYSVLGESVRAKADLIVLPTRPAAWSQRLRGGNLTDGILRLAPCPVVSINPLATILEE
ncbi:MAG: universal stress protein [Verrucomicrobiales bacterium]